MTALRELAAELSDVGMCDDDYQLGRAEAGQEIAKRILSILDAEGDGGAVAWQSKRRPEDYSDEWKDCTKGAFDIINRTKGSPWITRELFDRPSRSGVVRDEDVADLVSKAMRRAWSLGQTYWQQADSESWKQQDKSADTQRKFDALIEETLAAIQGERHERTTEIFEGTHEKLNDLSIRDYD